ncbi:hypothetical protein GCM10010423_75980 [Streptomyces levis]|uniref:Uncharacterized protein n=1 Tax=Streptomyces levis TaxID=285566 RepID=A0ABN3P989_9ACTN
MPPRYVLPAGHGSADPHRRSLSAPGHASVTRSRQAFRAPPVTRTSGSLGLPQAFDGNSRAFRELLEKTGGMHREKGSPGPPPFR